MILWRLKKSFYCPYIPLPSCFFPPPLFTFFFLALFFVCLYFFFLYKNFFFISLFYFLYKIILIFVGF
ncbi:hypothetical protein FG599_015105 [Salmonella enterica subsp. enterica serovar Anatum]|nr:hypothetical protein FG599_015105 [Salmonella enterica subsp. enterica serovar Anatum]